MINKYKNKSRLLVEKNDSKKIENLTNIEAMYLLEREEEVLKEEKISSETYRFDAFVFESPYQVKNKLLSSNESFRIFIDEKISLYLLGLPYETTHTEMVYVANENGFNTSIDDFNKNKLCAVFVPDGDEEYGYMAETSLASDDYDTVYEYDNFKVYSRYQDFSKFQLSSILGKYKKRKIKNINEMLKEDSLNHVDSEENELTAEQSEFFKNSKVRDENNRLLVVYHGTSKQFDDETFNSSINWFTADLDYAKGFGTWTGKKGFNYQCYLSCSKIFDCGPTDGPIFGLMPIKPYRFSSRFESIFKKLNTDEKLIRNMIEEVANEFDEKENGYKMKINVLTRSSKFRDLLVSQGYDCMRCVENENVVTFGVFNSNQIKKIDNKNPTNSNNINESKADEQKLIDFAGDSLAKRFLVIKNRLKSPENDIYYWLKKTPVELEDRVNEIENTTSKTKQKEIEKLEGAELVAEENGWKIYRIDSYEASCLYGKGTKWCTASTETSKHFENYKNKGIVLYYFIRNNEKYALALFPEIFMQNNIKTNYELYDAEDTLITDTKEIGEINLPKIPDVKLIPETLPYEIEEIVLVKVSRNIQGEFVVPDGIKIIDSYAFKNCKYISNITLPSGVTVIGAFAFHNCKSLTSITIPDTVGWIGESAFEGCESLTSSIIPSSVNLINDRAFSGCINLRSITIPNSVNIIGNRVFYSCPNLTIYAEAPEKQKDWKYDWNPDNRPVVWNYKNPTNSTKIKGDYHDT